MYPFIYCEKSRNDTISFYFTHGSTDYFLFCQKYRDDTYNAFYKGVPLDRAMRPSLAHNSKAVLKTIDKLPAYIKYVEKEEGFKILNKSIKKKAA